MSNTGPHFLASTSIPRGIVYVLLGSTTLVVTINSFDSGIAKTPLLVLSLSLLVAVYCAQVIWNGKIEFRRSPADIPLLVFLLLLLVSPMYSSYQWRSWQALAVWLPFVGCFFAGTQLFARRHDVSNLMWASAVIACVVCIVGLMQFFYGDDLFLNFFLGKDRRVTSTLGNATYLSGYIVLLFPVLLAFTVANKANTWKRSCLIVLLCALAFLLLGTLTRSSIAAFVLSLALFGVLWRRGMRKGAFAWIALGIMVAGSAVYLSPRLLERIEAAFRSDSSSSFVRRMHFWEAGYRAFKAAPFFGHGIGSYEEVMRGFRSPEYWVVKSEDVVPHAHNEIIETAVDLGGAGVIAYLTIVGTVLFAGWKPHIKEKENDRLMRVGLFCSLFAILFDNLANMSLRVAPVGATAWLFLGLLASQSSTHSCVVEFRSSKPLILLPFAGWLIIIVVFGANELNVYKADRHVSRAIIAVEANELAKGIGEYRLATALDPENLLARSNLALALLVTGRNKEALETAEELRKLSPTYPKSHLMQAAALVALKRYPEALEHIKQELAQCSHPSAYLYMAEAYMGLGDSAGEIIALEQVLLANLKGHVEYELWVVSERVLQLAHKDEDLARFREIYAQLSSQFPSNNTVAATLAGLNARLAESSKSHEPVQEKPG